MACLYQSADATVIKSLADRIFRQPSWFIKSSFFTIFAFGTIVFLLKLEFVSRIFFGLLILTSFTLLLIEKVIIFYIMHSIRKRGYNYRRIIIVGTGKRAAEFTRKIHNHPEWGIKILGVLDDEPGRGIKKVNGIDVIAPLKDISKILPRRVRWERKESIKIKIITLENLHIFFFLSLYTLLSLRLAVLDQTVI